MRHPPRSALFLLALVPSLATVPASAAIRTQEGAAAVAPQTPDEQVAALIEGYNKEYAQVVADYRKAETEEERGRILAGLPGPAYVPRFRAVAEAAKGTEAAAKAWLWVLRLLENDPALASTAIETLLSDHIQSPSLGELSGELRYASDTLGRNTVLEALRAIVAESPHEPVRAGALFTLGAVLTESPEAAHKKEGRDCFEAVIAEYGALAYRGSSTYGAAAAGFLYEADHLQIGMTAPDFETVDENGVPWKLSDYRGKVVVVDFWGFW